VEVIQTIAALQKEHPKNVVALMGNHEDFSEEGSPNFNRLPSRRKSKQNWKAGAHILQSN
jgi:hypothetical protein